MKTTEAHTFVGRKYRVQFPVIPVHKILVNGHRKRMRNALLLLDDLEKRFSRKITAADVVSTRVDPVDALGNVIDGQREIDGFEKLQSVQNR